MWKLIMVMYSMIIIMGIVLLFAVPLYGVFSILFGIGGIILYKRSTKEEQKPAEPTPPVVTHTEITPTYKVSVKTNIEYDEDDNPIIKPSRETVKTYHSKVAGVTFKCERDKDTTRKEIIELLIDGQELNVDKFEYNDQPACLLIEPMSRFDIGTLPKNVAAEIEEKYPDNELEVFVEEAGTFYPEDSEEEKPYCRVTVFVLK